MTRETPVTRHRVTTFVPGPARDLDALACNDRSPPSDLSHLPRLPGRRALVVDGPVDLDEVRSMAPNPDAARPRPPLPDRRPRAGREQALRSSRTRAKSPRLLRPRLTLTAGALIFLLSFVVALRLTKPAMAPTPAMATLAAATVSDFKTLMSAVKAAGLKGTPDVKGGLDEIKRLDGDQVAVKGWAAQTINGGAPLTVLVFADGRNKLTMETRGARPDMTDALGLSGEAAENVAFAGTLACSRGQKLIVVAVTQSDVYGYFGSPPCP
jgi:hypothetical protein